MSPRVSNMFVLQQLLLFAQIALKGCKEILNSCSKIGRRNEVKVQVSLAQLSMFLLVMYDLKRD